VFRDSRQHSLSAGAGRLIATCVSFALCLHFLWLIPANVAGMAILLAVGTLVMVMLDRRESGLPHLLSTKPEANPFNDRSVTVRACGIGPQMSRRDQPEVVTSPFVPSNNLVLA
jgi:hypothetical protein